MRIKGAAMSAEVEPQIRLTLSPVHNSLNSLYLLSSSGYGSMRSPWVRNTRAALGADASRLNDLVTKELGAALYPDREWSDVPTWLSYLKSERPDELWTAVNRLVSPGSDRVPSEMHGSPKTLYAAVVGHLEAMWAAY